MQYHNEKAPAAAGGEYDLSSPPVPQPSGTGKGKRASRYLNLKRLPTLQEVLDRRTRAPLDLFCFYVRPCFSAADRRSSSSASPLRMPWTFGSTCSSTRTCARRTSRT